MQWHCCSMMKKVHVYARPNECFDGGVGAGIPVLTVLPLLYLHPRGRVNVKTVLKWNFGGSVNME